MSARKDSYWLGNAAQLVAIGSLILIHVIGAVRLEIYNKIMQFSAHTSEFITTCMLFCFVVTALSVISDGAKGPLIFLSRFIGRPSFLPMMLVTCFIGHELTAMRDWFYVNPRPEPEKLLIVSLYLISFLALAGLASFVYKERLALRFQFWNAWNPRAGRGFYALLGVAWILAMGIRNLILGTFSGHEFGIFFVTGAGIISVILHRRGKFLPVAQSDKIVQFYEKINTQEVEKKEEHKEQLTYEQIFENIKKDVIGQDHAIQEVLDAIVRRTNLRQPNKPLGVFMFVGATGSGKTELAKSIAKNLFGDRLVRFDMNEFTDKYSISRLVGSAPGYVDSERGGQLTQAIKNLGNGVILFDEIEKADPKVYTAIMTLLDEGRITERSTGETMYANNFLIILTSNAESKRLAELAETISEPMELRRAVRDALTRGFKPEVIARMDDIILFRKLRREDLARVIGKFILQFAEQLNVTVESMNVNLIIEIINKHEKVENYGIRELIRIVERDIVDGMIRCKQNGYTHIDILCSTENIVVVPAKPKEQPHGKQKLGMVETLRQLLLGANTKKATHNNQE